MRKAKTSDESSTENKDKVLSSMKGDKENTVFGLDYFLDILPGVKPDKVKKLMNRLILDGSVEFWSADGTYRYALKGKGKYRHKTE